MTNDAEPRLTWEECQWEEHSRCRSCNGYDTPCAMCCRRIRLARDWLRLDKENRRLREALGKATEAIESLDVDALGVVPEAHDCPAYPIRDALLHDLHQRLKETGHDQQ